MQMSLHRRSQWKAPIAKGHRLRIRFQNAIRYRLDGPNDEGWYLGQCRFSRLARAWGEFYEVHGDLRLAEAQGAWIKVGGTEDARTHHYLFYLREGPDLPSDLDQTLSAQWLVSGTPIRVHMDVKAVISPEKGAP